MALYDLHDQPALDSPALVMVLEGWIDAGFAAGTAIQTLLENLDALSDAAAGRGSISLAPEIDEVVRRVPAVVRVGQQLVPAQTLELLRVATGQKSYAVSTDARGAKISWAAPPTAIRLYALMSIAVLKPSRLVLIVAPLRSSIGAYATECSRKSIAPNSSFVFTITALISSSLVTSSGTRNLAA